MAMMWAHALSVVALAKLSMLICYDVIMISPQLRLARETRPESERETRAE